MLAIALGLEAIDAGHRVYYTTAAELVARTSKAAAEGRWAAAMRFWAGPAVLIVDELGCAPRGAMKPGGTRGPPPAAATAG